MKYYDPQTLSFLLSEVHHLEELLGKERYAAYDMQSIDLLLDAVSQTPKYRKQNGPFKTLKVLDPQ